MDNIYFKKRKNFDFKPHKYDLGIPLWQTNSHLDMHFLNKIFDLEEGEHENLYNYHKHYYLTVNSGAKLEFFLKKLFDLLDRSMKVELSKNPIKMNSSLKIKWEKRIEKYESFLRLLKDKDDWGIVEFENETQKIKELKDEIEELESQLKQYTVKNEHRIEINEEDINVFIDILHQIQKLPHSNPNKSKGLVISHSQNTWAKILSNYFTHGPKDIPFNTAKKKFKLDDIGKFDKKRIYEIKIRN